MSRESGKISKESKSADDRGEVVSSASKKYLDGTCQKSLRLIIDLSEIAQDKALTEEENED